MTAPISSDFNNHELERTGLTKFGETFLANQASKLYQFAQGSVIQGHGFGYLDTFGKVDATKSREVYVQSRMIQVFGLSHYFGDENGKQLVRHGIEVLNSDFHDKNFGGYFNAIDKFGAPAHPEKLAYDQMFVLLAAVMGVALNVPGAKELFEEIDQIIDSKYWDEKFGLMNNSWDSSFMTLDLYRGVNANMHAVEALLAAYDLTKNKKYQDRALRICRAVALDFAKPNLWLLPEHFDANWKVDQEFNINNKADQFRPYGVTIGHLFEWSRLLLQLQISLMNDGIHCDWIEESAVSLYETGKDFGWSADGTAGFIYTMDWKANPVVSSRMHWVAAEAVMAAYILWKTTGDATYLEDYEQWWAYIVEHVIDEENGSWFHELDEKLKPESTTWAGKPDVYHAFNACLLPLLPLSSSFIGGALQTRR